MVRPADLAYVERSAAAFSAGSPQRVGAASLSEPDARRQAIDDLVKARDLGSYSPGDLTALGFYWFVEGVMRRDDELLERSQAVSREAISVASERGEDTDPVPHFNLGVTLLAAERFDEAEAAYRAGIERTPEDLGGSFGVVAGALTDLDLVEQRGTARTAAEARRLKGIVMAGSSYPRSCLADGKYRLELYDGRKVVARRSVTIRYGSEQALEALDLGIAMCRPQGWKLWAGAQHGLSAGVVAPDGERGALALRITQRVAAPDRPRVLETVLRRHAGVIGATVAGRGTNAGLVFMDIPRPTTRRYLAGGKEVLAGIGNDTDGSVVIGIVFGPRRWFATPTPRGLFDAMVLAYQPLG